MIPSQSEDLKLLNRTRRKKHLADSLQDVAKDGRKREEEVNGGTCLAEHYVNRCNREIRLAIIKLRYVQEKEREKVLSAGSVISKLFPTASFCRFSLLAVDNVVPVEGRQRPRFPELFILVAIITLLAFVHSLSSSGARPIVRAHPRHFLR